MQDMKYCMQVLSKLLSHTHLIIGIAKYVLLLLFGWNITSIVEPAWLIGLGIGLFVLFDLCALALWYILRQEKGKHSLAQLFAFYIVQVLAASVLWIVVFQPSLLADLVGDLVNKVFK